MGVGGFGSNVKSTSPIHQDSMINVKWAHWICDSSEWT